MYSKMCEGEKTQLANEQIWGLPDNDESDDDLLWSSEYISQMDETKLFLEKLSERMRATGFDGNIDDLPAAHAFLKKCCKDAAVSIGRGTLANWLETGCVSTDARGRENIYKLCFALKMNADETRDFFHKALLTRPFNYKSLYESVCFFCLNTGRTYPDVERLVQEIQSSPQKEAEYFCDPTVKIGENIESYKTEEELIVYWLQNSAGFTDYRHTAIKKANSLIQNCYKAAKSYYNRDDLKYNNGDDRKSNSDDDLKYKSPDRLLGAMFGINPRASQKGKFLNPKAFSESDFPPAIKRNFPQRQQINNILHGTPTDDVLRKVLIAFTFFDCFTRDPIPDFDFFEEQINECLEECGYVGMYCRNPYDWMFMHCATEDDPLLALHELIGEFVHEVPAKSTLKSEAKPKRKFLCF